MVQIFLAGFLLLCYGGLSWASWEAQFEVDRATNGINKSVRVQDTRGNSLIVYRDVRGAFEASLYLNAYLPEPERPGTATPVLFTIDDNPPHSIDTGGWVGDSPYRILTFQLSGPPGGGLSEAMIEVLEGKRISFSYPAGVLGRETVRFSFADTGSLVANTLGIALPIDHARHSELRLAAEPRTAPRKPLDAEVERTRQILIERHRAMIRSRVLDLWMRPVHWSGLNCTLKITVMSTGEVLQVEVLRGSGDPEFDASMATAVRDASPLPLPADPVLFENFQRLEMSFDPPDTGARRAYLRS